MDEILNQENVETVEEEVQNTETLEDKEVAEEVASEEATIDAQEEAIGENAEISEEPASEEIQEEVATEEAISEEVIEEVAETQEESAEETQDGEDGDEESDDNDEEPEEDKSKQAFKLTLPENYDEICQVICTKRGRKLIYKPNEVLFEGSYKVLGTDKKNEEGIKVKDILDAEIKEGLKQGYLDKFDGLKTSEIKEEYENDIVYELAEQEFRKMGIVLDNGKLKVYVYDWDRKGMHHIGFIDENEASETVKYFEDKENYSFDICGIITGGKGKRVTKDEKGKIKITKEKGDPIGVELDVTIIKRKD
ncbi:MAG: hypothetical protein IJF75_01535 [Clostridia bacterium]|nr:hypothetical protein [Clostridia bacterium]